MPRVLPRAFSENPMSSIISFTADVHAHAYPNSPTLDDGSNKQLNDIIAALDGILEHTKRVPRSAIVVVGDLFHDRKGVRPEALHRVSDWLSRCRSSGVEVHILVGNHDLSFGGDGCASVQALSGLAYIHGSVETAVISGVKVGFLPYMDSPEAVRASVERLRKDGATVLAAHLGIGDPKHADCVPTDYEVPGRVNVSDLCPQSWDQIFLGHYHKTQQLASNARYVGSPLQLSFKEAGERKGFYVLSTDDGVVDFIENRISPKFVEVSFTDADLITAAVDAGDYLRVTKVPKDSVEKVQQLAKSAEGLSRIRIDVLAQQQSSARINADTSEADILRQYVVAKIPNAELCDVAAFVKYGMALTAKGSKS